MVGIELFDCSAEDNSAEEVERGGDLLGADFGECWGWNLRSFLGVAGDFEVFIGDFRFDFGRLDEFFEVIEGGESFNSQFIISSDCAILVSDIEVIEFVFGDRADLYEVSISPDEEFCSLFFPAFDG